MAQGDERTGEEGTNSISVVSHDEIRSIPKDRVVTYASIVIDYCPPKDEPNGVCITAGANLIKYPSELTTQTANFTTSIFLWKGVFSTKDAIFMVINIKTA